MKFVWTVASGHLRSSDHCVLMLFSSKAKALNYLEEKIKGLNTARKTRNDLVRRTNKKMCEKSASSNITLEESLVEEPLYELLVYYKNVVQYVAGNKYFNVEKTLVN